MEFTEQRLTQRSVAAALCLTLVASALVVLSGAFTTRAEAAYSCDQLFEDPADDAINDPPGDGGNVDALDITGGGIAAETGSSFTTEIGVKDLSKTINDPTVAGARWTFRWTTGDVMFASDVSYNIDTDEITYTWGTVTIAPNGSSLYTPADPATTGTFNEGPDGSVQVVVPLGAEGGPEAGAKLTETFASASITRQAPIGGPSAGSTLDRGPDADFGTDYTLGTCSGAGGNATSPGVTLKFETLTPKKGSIDKATAGLKTCKGHKGTNIKLQKKKSGVFKTIAKKKLGSTCKATFKVRAKFRKATFRALWPKQDADHKKGVSKPRTLITH
ncbi:MAG: hypothetical protein QOH26_2076 [Actinomycetota bacterium]|nr:hypothetical protein [Actinomycetota bacterium]